MAADEADFILDLQQEIEQLEGKVNRRSQLVSWFTERREKTGRTNKVWHKGCAVAAVHNGAVCCCGLFLWRAGEQPPAPWLLMRPATQPCALQPAFNQAT